MQTMELDKNLIEEEKVLCVNRSNKTCLMCGDELPFKRVWDYDTLLHPTNNLCPTCCGWYKKVEDMNDHQYARINGEQYRIKSDSSSKMITIELLTIKFNDGRIVQTNKLWHQGRIPLIWRRYLPDNAVFAN